MKITELAQVEAIHEGLELVAEKETNPERAAMIEELIIGAETIIATKKAKAAAKARAEEEFRRKHTKRKRPKGRPRQAHCGVCGADLDDPENVTWRERLINGRGPYPVRECRICHRSRSGVRR